MSELVLYNRHVEQLRATVAHLETVDEAKDLADKAAAAQVWARRVRLGQDAVNHAGEVKVRAERRAGQLLTSMRQNGQRARGGQESSLPTLNEIGVTRDQSHEWQALGSIRDDVFDAAILEEKAEGVLTREGVKRRAMDVHYSSATPEWETPQGLFDELAAEFGFDLDVCATAENAKCDRYFTATDDGLAQDWSGTCWMNPPYGDEIAKWVAKAWAAARHGCTVVCLVPARVDTGWWWDYCRFGEVRFLRGRLRFGGGTTGAPFPSAVVVFGRPADVVWWERAA